MKRISVSKVRQFAEKKGIKSQSALATAAGINPNTARRWWIDDPTLTRYEVSVIIAFCDVLEIQPGDLFEYAPNGDEVPDQ